MLDAKIANRLKELQSSGDESAKAREEAIAQAKQTFEDRCTALMEAAGGLGAKETEIASTYAETTIPWCAFNLAGVRVALEWRRSDRVVVLINRAELGTIAPNEAGELVKAEVESIVVDAIAQYAHQGGEVKLAPSKSSKTTEKAAD